MFYITSICSPYFESDNWTKNNPMLAFLIIWIEKLQIDDSISAKNK